MFYRSGGEDVVISCAGCYSDDEPVLKWRKEANEVGLSGVCCYGQLTCSLRMLLSACGIHIMQPGCPSHAYMPMQHTRYWGYTAMIHTGMSWA